MRSFKIIGSVLYSYDAAQLLILTYLFLSYIIKLEIGVSNHVLNDYANIRFSHDAAHIMYFVGHMHLPLNRCFDQCNVNGSVFFVTQSETCFSFTTVINGVHSK